MGKMTVKGYAEREVESDLVRYKFNFVKVDYSIDASVKAVSTELERFLEIIEKKIGIAPDVFRIEDNSTSKEYRPNSDKEQKYKANRKISAVLPMSAKLSDLLMNIIAEYEFNVEVEEHYIVSDIEEIYKELLKLAIEDSKNKAEMIVSFAGEKISGINKLEILTNNFSSVYDEDDDEDECYRGYMLDDILRTVNSKSSQMSSPVVKLNQNVEIVWNIE